MSRNINIKAIRRDGGTQARVCMSQETIDAYAEHLKGGGRLPDVVLFNDGTDMWLADGFHTVAAHEAAGLVSVPSDVREGTKRDAFIFALGANATHGMHRTTADKRNAVMLALSDPEIAKLSNRDIADLCKVSHPFVGSLREGGTKPKPEKPKKQPPAPPPPPAAPPPPPATPPAAPAPTPAPTPTGNVTAPTPAPQPPAAPPAFNVPDLSEVVEEQERELVELRAQLEAANADDLKAEAMKQVRLKEIAERRYNEIMESAAERDRKLTFYENQLMRIGRAIGEDDPKKIAPTVEQWIKQAVGA